MKVVIFTEAEKEVLVGTFLYIEEDTVAVLGTDNTMKYLPLDSCRIAKVPDGPSLHRPERI